VSTDPIGGAVLRYRVMAYVVGVGLVVLVCIGVPLQYAANSPGVVQVVGPIHGALYIVYLLAAADLARRARFGLLQLAAMVAAGFVPFLAFVMERHVVHRLERERALEGTGAPSDWLRRRPILGRQVGQREVPELHED
jgi:integral membrane protein